MGTEEKHNIEVVVAEAYQHPPPQHPYILNNPSAPPQHPYVMNNPSAPPAPPPTSVVNTNVYVNSSERTVTGYPVPAAVEPGPPSPPTLPCCGIGVGWFLFILGWFLCGIPWYVGTFILFCSKIDPRERAGYIACTIFAIVISITAIIMSAEGH